MVHLFLSGYSLWYKSMVRFEDGIFNNNLEDNNFEHMEICTKITFYGESNSQQEPMLSSKTIPNGRHDLNIIRDTNLIIC